MAVTERPIRNSVAMMLNNGTIDGEVQLVSVSLGTLSKDDWDADKVMAIVDAAEPCLSKQVYEVRHTEVSRLYND